MSFDRSLSVSLAFGCRFSHIHYYFAQHSAVWLCCCYFLRFLASYHSGSRKESVLSLIQLESILALLFVIHVVMSSSSLGLVIDVSLCDTHSFLKMESTSHLLFTVICDSHKKKSIPISWQIRDGKIVHFHVTFFFSCCLFSASWKSLEIFSWGYFREAVTWTVKSHSKFCAWKQRGHQKCLVLFTTSLVDLNSWKLSYY